MADTNLDLGTIAEAALKGTLKETLIKVATEQAMTWLISKAGFLAWPVVNPVVSWVITKFVTLLLEKTILGINEAWIKIENTGEIRAVQEASMALQALPDDASAEDVEQAREAFRKAAGDLISLRTKRL